MARTLEIKKSNEEEIIKETVRVLKNGGLVVFPTETMYGIGADPTNQEAVNKLLAYKTRREGKPLSIAVSSVKMAKEYVEVNNIAKNLYDNFLPGPLTVISKSLGKTAKGVESETGTIGVRIPAYPLIISIINNFKKPITATSANASYKKRPYSVEDILKNISSKQEKLIDLILDAGQLPKREPSTVVDTTLDQETVLRQGNIKLTPILEKTTNSPEETQDLGRQIIDKYKHYLGYKSVIFAMQGELGAGKTEMTKGIARQLGIEENINSPTFIIEKEYKIKAVKGSFLSEKKIKLFHIDTWRLFDEKELEDLEFFEKINEGNIFVIEWADKVSGILERVAEDAIIIWIKIEHRQDINSRKIIISDFTN